MYLSDFQYELPSDLIARYPLPQRSDSRLLCLDKITGEIVHRQFTDILSLISPGDLLVLNNTKVLPARLFGCKESGGKIEVLVERILDSQRVLAHVRASKSPKAGSYLLFAEMLRLQVIKRCDDLFELFSESLPILNLLEKIGQIPLPPYFQREPEENDKERYQTIYAEHQGSVAAPTAGLHFDENLLDKLQSLGVNLGYVTLHVGAGTFAPVRTEDITQHRMHAEYFEVSDLLCQQIIKTKSQGGKVIAVGTTSARSLETVAGTGQIQPMKAYTDIFIYPGYDFKCVDTLITNLHLPGSTLLMLISAFAGYEAVMQAYKVAVAERYRFFSYGDAMWIG